MNKEIRKVKDIFKHGCDDRHQVTEHIFTCPHAKDCPCAELCLNRDNLFDPEEAAAVWMGMNRVKHDHDYRQGE